MLACLGALLRQVPSDFVLIDGPEFAIAARELGIPHPSAYPLFSLLAHPFTLLPLGSIGSRVALASLLFGLLGGWAGALFLTRLGLHRRAMLPAMLVLCCCQPLLRESLGGEVYSLHFLCVWLLLLGQAAFLARPAPRLAYLGSFLLGLSFANHHSLLLALPGLGMGLAVGVWRGWTAGLPGWSTRHLPRALALIFVFGVLGFATNLYLPLRSIGQPPIDRVNPESASGFSRVVLQRVSGSTADTKANGWTNFVFHAHRLRLVLSENGPSLLALLVLAAIGLLAALRGAPLPALVWCAVAGLSLLGAMWSFYSRTWEISYLVEPFLIPGVLLAVGLALLGAACTVARLLGGMPQEEQSRLAIAWMVALALTQPWTWPGRPTLSLAPGWAREVLHQAPQDALVLCLVDEIFPLSYMQIAEQMRPDVRVLHQVSLTFRPDDWWESIPTDASMEYPEASQAPRGSGGGVHAYALLGYLGTTERRRVLLTRNVPEMVPPGYALAVRGLLYELVPEREVLAASSDLSAVWRRTALPEAGLLPSALPDAEREMLDNYTKALNNGAGLLWRGLGKPEQAQELLGLTLLLEPANPTANRVLKELGEE